MRPGRRLPTTTAPSVSGAVVVGSSKNVRHRSQISNLPIRAAAGAFILNSGLTKLKAEKEHAQQLHGMATGAYPMLENVPPEQFAKALAAAEVALGGALLLPVVVSDGLAGLALSAFAGGLLGLYAKMPGTHQEGSLRPTQEGTALAKDVWLAGIGVSLMASSITSRRISHLEHKAKKSKQKAKEAKSTS